MISSGKMRRVHDVAYVKGKRNAYKILVGRPEREAPVGR
jgi:hypothetical protein